MIDMNDEIMSELAGSQRVLTTQVLSQKSLLTDFISAPIVTPPSKRVSPYLVATERLTALFERDRIVQRQCYDHLLPILQEKLDNGQTVSVEGSPGIGKTVFGYFLLRLFVRQKRSTVYWDGNQATFFTQNENFIKLYNLRHKGELLGETWHWGAWEADAKALEEFLLCKDIYVIHDPAEDFKFGGTRVLVKNLVIILSFGHALVGAWSTKGTGAPKLRLFMPVFALDEIFDNKENIFHGKELSTGKFNELYNKFSGAIRHWGRSTESDAWDELVAKMQDVTINGSLIIARTSSHRGSIVHVAVDFDARRSIYPNYGHNTFQREGFVIGSYDLTTLLSETLSNYSKDQLRAFMNAIRGQRGAESMYGLLFKQHAHEVLCRPEVKLNFKVVRYDGKNRDEYATTTIQISKKRNVLVFDGQDSKGINETVGQTQQDYDTYFLPACPNFPTYDAAMVVPGTVVGLTRVDRVGLLLQMTVSGASSVLRKPEHAVKNYMRKDMHSALAQVWPDSKPALSVTTFCVPTACFHPFLFQPEHIKNSSQPVAPENQAEYQFVIEIPEFLQLPLSRLPKDELDGENSRVHRYEMRTSIPKRVKLVHVHETENEEGGD